MERVIAGLTPRASIFGEPDFRRLWLVGFIGFAVRWLEMLASAVFAYHRTHSPLVVAILTMLRILPMGLFGAPLGAAAERIERRTALIGIVGAMAVGPLAVAVLAYAGRLTIWELAIASFWDGIGWASDNPVRRTMLGETVGAHPMSAAMALDVGANNASILLGPTLGGLLLASVGIAGAFAASTLCYVVAILVALRVRHRDGPRPVGSASVLERVLEGLIVVRRDRRLVAVLIVTILYNIFGWPFTSMVPVIGQQSLHLGAGGVGLLTGMLGAGACLGAVLIAGFARPPQFSRLYLGGVLCYFVMQMAFAVAPQPLLAGAALVAAGVANAGFSTMQATLVYLAAPPEMRSRIYGVLSVCIGAGPLGFLYVGLLGRAIGAPAATVALGAEGVLALALTWPLWRRLVGSD